MAGGCATSGEDRGINSWDCGVGWIEEGSTARAVAVQAGSVSFMELD